MTDRELMQQSLEALETCKVYGEDNDEWAGFSAEKVGAAVTALRERLAQPEQREVEIEFKEWMHPQIGVVPVDPKTPLVLRAHIREKNA